MGKWKTFGDTRKFREFCDECGGDSEANNNKKKQAERAELS